jgi:hypothetical protein
MKGLTLIQPYATLVALGEKGNETRGWATSYRGDVAITASKGFPRDYRDLCLQEPFLSVLMLRLRENMAGHRDPETVLEEKLPLGKVVAVVEIVDCVPTPGELFNSPGSVVALGVNKQEFAFGNYAPGRFIFRLANVRRLRDPVPCVGARMFWTLPADVEAAVRAQL